MRDVQVEIKAEPVSSQFFAGLGWQLPPGGGRTAEHAYAGLGAGIVPPPGPLRTTGGGGGGASERSELFGARGAPAPAGALQKVAGGSGGAEPPADHAAAPFSLDTTGTSCTQGPPQGVGRLGGAASYGARR